MRAGCLSVCVGKTGRLPLCVLCTRRPKLQLQPRATRPGGLRGGGSIFMLLTGAMEFSNFPYETWDLMGSHDGRMERRMERRMGRSMEQHGTRLLPLCLVDCVLG